MHPRTQAFILLWLSTFAFHTSICAEAANSSDVGRADLSLRQFIENTVETNPRVKAARMALFSDISIRDAESQPLYNPDFVLQAEDSESLTRTVGISQRLDWSGKRKARTKVADSKLHIAEAEFQAFRRAFTADLLEGLAKYQISVARNVLVLERQELMNDLVDPRSKSI